MGSDGSGCGVEASVVLAVVTQPSDKGIEMSINEASLSVCCPYVPSERSGRLGAPPRLLVGPRVRGARGGLSARLRTLPGSWDSPRGAGRRPARLQPHVPHPPSPWPHTLRLAAGFLAPSRAAQGPVGTTAAAAGCQGCWHSGQAPGRVSHGRSLREPCLGPPAACRGRTVEPTQNFRRGQAALPCPTVSLCVFTSLSMQGNF